jgi:hypothetical protein
MLRSDFHILSRMRAREARTLFGAKQFDSAYYLGGLAVECAIKACIARKTERFEFPDKKRAERAWSHQLEQLIHEAGLRTLMLRPVETQWTIVKDWNVDVRYAIGKPATETRDFLSAAIGRKGVVPWLKRYW